MNGKEIMKNIPITKLIGIILLIAVIIMEILGY